MRYDDKTEFTYFPSTTTPCTSENQSFKIVLSKTSSSSESGSSGSGSSWFGSSPVSSESGPLGSDPPDSDSSGSGSAGSWHWSVSSGSDSSEHKSLNFYGAWQCASVFQENGVLCEKVNKLQE